jgi:hypothetical protein
MIVEDYIVVQKSNHGPVKKMSIYLAADLLTLEEIGRLTKKKKVRKGNYLYSIEKFKIEEVDPYGDLESDECIEELSTEIGSEEGLRYSNDDKLIEINGKFITEVEFDEMIEIHNILDEEERNGR